MQHRWIKDEDGKINTFAYAEGNHNGPECELCGFSFCHHCDDRYEDECPVLSESESILGSELATVEYKKFTLFYKSEGSPRFLLSSLDRNEIADKIEFLRENGAKCIFIIRTENIVENFECI